MARQNLIVFFLLVTSILYAQAPAIQWQKSSGGTGNEYAYSLVCTSDAGYISAGFSDSNDGEVSGNHGGKDFWVVKSDAAGIIQWQKCYGGSRDEVAYSITQTSDGGFIIAGFSNSVDGQISDHHGGADTCDVWIVKIDSAGTLLWAHSYGGSQYDGAAAILQCADGNFIAAGYSESSDGDVTNAHGGSDVWVLKIAAGGGLLWQKSFGGASWDNAADVLEYPDGNFLVGGNEYSVDGDVSFNHGLSDNWILKLDSAGTLLWEKTYGGSANEGVDNVRATSDGGFITAGTTFSTDIDVDVNYACPELWLVKCDSSGIPEWKKTYGGQGSEAAACAVQTADGGYIVSCGSGSTDGNVSGVHGVLDIWVLKLDTAGTILWENCYGGPQFEGAAEVEPANGGYILCGQSMGVGGDITVCNGGYDFWLVKLDSIVGVDESTNEIQTRCYPNPFTESCTIEFANPGYESALFRLYNADGRLMDAVEIEHSDKFQFDRTSLAGGMYYYTIETQTGTSGRMKMIILPVSNF